MIEIILSEHQFARLKAAVPRGSVEHAALEAGAYFAGSELVPEPIAVTLTCSLELAQQLLAMARMTCPDVAPGFALRSTNSRTRPSQTPCALLARSSGSGKARSRPDGPVTRASAIPGEG